MAAWMLIPSPLVGPATWHGVATELRRRAHPVVVPELSPAADLTPPYLPAHVAEVVAAARGSGHGGDNGLILAGHSGAGPRLPAIGAALTKAGFPIEAYVFVDAGLPDPSRSPREAAAPEFQDLLEALVDEHGMLPPWSSWFGPDAMARLVPDETARATIVAELHRVPARLFDEVVPVPSGWPGAAMCGYVAFTYDADAEEAERRGWIVRRVEGGHLALVTDPVATVDAMLAVAPGL